MVTMLHKNLKVEIVKEEMPNVPLEYKFYHKLNTWLFLLWAFLNLMDYITTRFAPYELGFIEINPFIHSLIRNGWGWLFGFKLVIVSLFILMLYLFYSNGMAKYRGVKLMYHTFLIHTALIIVNTSYIFIVVSNIALINGVI